MCGIAGVIGNVTPDELERMTRALTHRGPDDEGFLIRDNVGLGHRRLSIIDTSSRGHQPMTLPSEDIVIVFNGEIYNFSVLRDVLKKEGRSFSSDSDTEVLLHLYSTRGEGFLDEVIGMFAIALYDFRKKKLILARDRMGEKPLYWSLANGTLRFASELGALMTSSIPRELNRDALHQYLQFDYVPTPHTILRNVYKLEPATILCFENGLVRKHSFWKPTDALNSLTETEVEHRLDELLGASVARQLISDVPLGVYLSGGLDSSTIAHYAAGSSSRKIHTFSIGFDDPSFDESLYAREAARHIGTEHHELVMRENDALDLMGEIPEVFSEPVADASVIPTLFLSRFTRESVTVALGGDGGDELFAGYPTFQAESAFSVYRYVPSSVRSLLRKGIHALPVSYANFPLSYNLQKFVSAESDDQVRRHLEWLGTFGSKKRENLTNFRSAKVFDSVESIMNTYEGDDVGNKLLYAYMRTYLMDQVLVKVDRASMHYGLETRAPFLDHTVVDFLLSVPFTFKYRRGQTKRLLKNIMRHNLPDMIIDRKKKGFGIPLARWLLGPLKPLCDELLSEESLAHGLFNIRYIERLKNEHFAHTRDNRKELWNLMVFQMWHKRWVK